MPPWIHAAPASATLLVSIDPCCPRVQRLPLLGILPVPLVSHACVLSDVASCCIVYVSLLYLSPFSSCVLYALLASSCAFWHRSLHCVLSGSCTYRLSLHCVWFAIISLSLSSLCALPVFIADFRFLLSAAVSERSTCRVFKLARVDIEMERNRP